MSKKDFHFKCPYHARVIKEFDRNKNRMVRVPFIVFVYFLCGDAIRLEKYFALKFFMEGFQIF
jgi:hypothetical protein